ncbi:hypothetical protein phiPsa267_042 [Pseudomonas phage phiPsa267]|uniref:Uncharacterized protein n=2 Tax=Otagovirus TaxID=2560197 RepID=A0A7G9V101_9CAUD|nr:hypothetical protein QGX19_gp042 [Pseudomonas phage phiPsa267]YP_010767826.1 hypothetical protein QGX20_gp040 [Pseudomonas phage phiPsa300]QNN99956.1 hypothetical protein phiPsa267_042 [Pseudomonas phage phiPsa267]QNO00131.1 hypothetical protein phiPsa300_040 [Pseudomonas phage phiPsa300]
MHYNEALADKQGLSDTDRVALDKVYEQLHYALEHPEVFGSVEDVVRELEYDLQHLWKFPQDPRFHRYQLEIKGCTCPLFDNMELFGHTADRYRVSDCPWHWKGEKV